MTWACGVETGCRLLGTGVILISGGIVKDCIEEERYMDRRYCDAGGASVLAGVILLLCLVMLAGCSVQRIETEKAGDLEYEQVEEQDIPEEMRGPIEERWKKPFFLTYADKGRLYIARGYGEQKTDAYKIQVEDFYESENAIVLKTTFLGPEPGENMEEEPTYPYIVLRTEYKDKDVIIE